MQEIYNLQVAIFVSNNSPESPLSGVGGVEVEGIRRGGAQSALVEDIEGKEELLMEVLMKVLMEVLMEVMQLTVLLLSIEITVLSGEHFTESVVGSVVESRGVFAVDFVVVFDVVVAAVA